LRPELKFILIFHAQRKLKLHIASKFARPGRRLIDWQVDSLLAARFQKYPTSPTAAVIGTTKEITETLCRGNFPEILTDNSRIEKYSRIAGGGEISVIF
jgi:hypothetical protein